MSKSAEGTGEKVLAAGEGAQYKRYGQQIDGGWNIAIYNDEDKRFLIVQIVSTLPSGPTIKPAPGSGFGSNDAPPPSTEMWWYDSSLLSKLTGTPDTIYIESQQISGDSVTLLSPSFNPSGPHFTSAESTNWGPLQVTDGSPKISVFCGKDCYNNCNKNLYVSIGVNDDDTAITKVVWFEESDAAPAYIVPATQNWTSGGLPDGTYQVASSLGQRIVP